VIDGEFGLGLLSDEQQDLFEEDQVCVRGVSEEMPRTVYVQKGVVEIPEAARRPLRIEEWETVEANKRVRDWKVMSRRFRIELPKRLKRPDGIHVEVEHQKFRGRQAVPGVHTFYAAGFESRSEANRFLVLLDVDDLVRYLRAKRIPQSAMVNVVVRYVPE